MDCGCGRSPTDKCIGWHELTEEQYQEELKKWEEENKDKWLKKSTKWTKVHLVKISINMNIANPTLFLIFYLIGNLKPFD